MTTIEESSAARKSLSQLLFSIRAGDSEALGELLQLYRNYLSVLATTQLDRRLRRRLNPSDVVQETMLAAHRDFVGFRGNSEGELLAWLRQILSHCLSHAIEAHVLAKKRDIRREIALDQAARNVEESAIGLSGILEAHTDSPSEACGRRELIVQLSDQLAKLKPDYRDVIVYRNLQGLSFDEIAVRMDRKAGTVRMLWLRAIERFKHVCDPIE